MRLTRRGMAVVAAALCCYAIGELAGYPFFRVLSGIGVGCLLAGVVTAAFRPTVEIHRTVYPDRIERGTPALATLLVRNTGTLVQSGFVASERVGAERHSIGVGSLASGAQSVYHYEIPTRARGRLEVGPLTMSFSDPLDLVYYGRNLGDTLFLHVYPRRHAMRPAWMGRPRHHQDGPTADPPLRGSADLRGVREYSFGDEVRHLHWKATARTGQLMVREYSDPSQPGCTIVLDTRPAAMSPAVFEEAVDVAASLLYASAAAGQRCRLLTPAETDARADSGVRGVGVLLDELCLMGQHATDDAPLVPLTASRPDGIIVIITGPVADLGVGRSWRPDTVIRLGVTRPAAPGVITAMDAAHAAAIWNASRTGR